MKITNLNRPVFLVILCILSGVTSFTIGASENDAATPNDIATGLSDYPHALAAPNTISFPTDEFSGGYDTDGIHQVNTTDFGNITFKTTDDGTGTAFGSLTPIAGSLNRGFAHGSAITAIPSADGLGYTSNAGNGQNGLWFVFASDDGGEFNFTGFDIRESLGVFNRIEVHGFRNGIEVVSEEVGFTASTNNTGRTLTDMGFQNVDEIRIRQKTTGFFDSGTPGSESLVYDNLILDTAIVPNTAPTASGIPFDLTVVEDTASNIDLSSVTFADVDGDSLTVTLTATAGTFAATTGGGVTVGGSGTGTLTLAGTAANINTYLDTASNVQYTGAANANGNDAAFFTIQANDGTVNPTLGTVNLDITAVNDAPTASGIPSDLTVVEDTASNIDLSAVTFADVDNNTLTVTLTATAGTWAATSVVGVTIGGSGTGTLILAGTAANINTYLDTASNVQYTGAANASGNDAATFTIQVNDGTVNPTLGTVNLDITAVNDVPTASGIPSDVTVIEDTASNVNLSAVTFVDVDGGSLTVTLTATAGTWAATTSGGVTVGGSDTGALTLAGTAANINTYLDTASNVQYTGAANVNGNDAATFTIRANDGTVNPTLGTVNLDITAVNDHPAGATLPTAVTVTEDTQSHIDLGDSVFSDVDSTSITVTLTMSAGTFATPADGTGVGVTETLQGATEITLAGSPADINVYLDTASNIQYTPASNVSGDAAAAITVTANDGDGSGDVNIGTVNVNVTPVNDIPLVSNLPSDIILIINSQSQIDFSGVSFDDVDSAVITVTLTASAGVFAVPGDGAVNGVTATLVNATTITLAGSAAGINAYLDTIANIQYTSVVGVSGENAATILVDVNDGDGSGNINLGTINIDIAYDFTVAAQQSLSGSEVITCPQDKTLVLDGSATGFDYYLRQNNDFAVIEGPISGTGSSLEFETGVVNQTTSYEAFAANPSFALAFDGVDSDVVIPHSSDFNFSDGLTIEAWVRPDDITVGFQEIFRKENNGSDRILLSFQDNGTTLSFGIETSGDGYTELDVPINAADYNGQWVHIVATFDDPTNAMRLYRNGIEIGNQASNGMMETAASPSNAHMGSSSGVAEFFDGQIAALRIWNTAPSTQTEVDDLLRAGQANLITGTEPGLVAYYAFFAGAGSVLNDASNDNSGDISGAQWINGIHGGVGTVVSNTVQLSCVVYVDLNATGADDGSSWADAFDTIQEGVDASGADGLIRVAEGNYMITDEIMIDQHLNIRGGFPTGGGTQDIENHPTTLDAFEAVVADRQRVLRAQHTSGVLYLEGLTIKNGLNVVDGQGGGIFTSGDLRLNQVNISDNSAGISGGGIHSESGDITLIYSTVSNNVVDGSFGSGTGGGIYSNSGSITLINTTISNNEITASDFAIGGGVFSNSGQIWAVNSQINNNLTATTTTFSEGGGLITNLGSIHLINSAVINNQIASFGSFQGGGIVGDVSLENSMLWGNEESFDGVNFTPSEFQSNALITNHSLIKGLDLTADDGLDASDPGFDPLFTDEMNADFSPQSGSPLLDAGDVNLLPADAFDVDGDADITERIPLDLAGMSRASGSEVDIGPYEFQTEYLVGGQLTGLLPSNSITIQNNGNDDLVLTGDGAFVFGTPVIVGGAYVVSILVQPDDPIQPCTVTSATGSITDQDITDVVVTCEMGDDLIFRDGFGE